MNRRKIQLWLIIPVMSTLLVACNNQWNEHVEIGDKTLNSSVIEAIQSRSELSAFYAMLQTTGFDQLLATDNEFTVLAPSNSALAIYANASKEQQIAIVKNHIAYLSFNVNQLQLKTELTMINGKKLDLSALTVEATNRDILCGNGILHSVNKAIAPSLNIYEYLSTLSDKRYIQLDSLLGKTRQVMDQDKSIQTGVNNQGQAVYDTIWTTKNHFFDQMPLNNEDSIYSFVLLENDNFNAIKAKYAKYMQQSSNVKTDSLATDELIKDLVFQPNSNQALSGVTVDFSQATVVTQYTASNGTIRIMKGVNIRMKENKIRSIYVEGENYKQVYDPKHVLTRLRPWARGGMDVLVSGNTNQTRDSISVANGSIVTITYRFYYDTNLQTTVVNYFLQYQATLNSVDYDIYWMAYDDMPLHVGTDGYDASTLSLNQKLFISLPQEKVLKRESNGQISNNYLGNTTAFVGTSLAGARNESHLSKYTLGVIPTTYITTQIVDDPYTFSVPVMGNTTFMVCNTSKATGGVMFLDYIKLVPRIADED